MRRSVTLMAIIVGVVFPVLQSAADEHVVSNNNMQFQVDGAKVKSITIKAGDQVLFRNDDRVVHNVYSRTPGFEFDLGSMRRGTSAKHTFAKAGDLDVECAIHPHMKLKLQVRP